MSHAELSKTWDVVKRLTVVEPSNVQNYLVLARISFAQNRKKNFYDAATRAIKLGGRFSSQSLGFRPDIRNLEKRSGIRKAK
jgi:hypothetical protein